MILRKLSIVLVLSCGASISGMDVSGSSATAQAGVKATATQEKRVVTGDETVAQQERLLSGYEYFILEIEQKLKSEVLIDGEQFDQERQTRFEKMKEKLELLSNGPKQVDELIRKEARELRRRLRLIVSDSRSAALLGLSKKVSQQRPLAAQVKGDAGRTAKDAHAESVRKAAREQKEKRQAEARLRKAALEEQQQAQLKVSQESPLAVQLKGEAGRTAKDAHAEQVRTAAQEQKEKTQAEARQRKAALEERQQAQLAEEKQLIDEQEALLTSWENALAAFETAAEEVRSHTKPFNGEKQNYFASIEQHGLVNGLNRVPAATPAIFHRIRLVDERLKAFIQSRSGAFLLGNGTNPFPQPAAVPAATENSILVPTDAVNKQRELEQAQQEILDRCEQRIVDLERLLGSFATDPHTQIPSLGAAGDLEVAKHDSCVESLHELANHEVAASTDIFVRASRLAARLRVFERHPFGLYMYGRGPWPVVQQPVSGTSVNSGSAHAANTPPVANTQQPSNLGSSGGRKPTAPATTLPVVAQQPVSGTSVNRGSAHAANTPPVANTQQPSNLGSSGGRKPTPPATTSVPAAPRIPNRSAVNPGNGKGPGSGRRWLKRFAVIGVGVGLAYVAYQRYVAQDKAADKKA